jgi:hypothetical protein
LATGIRKLRRHSFVDIKITVGQNDDNENVDFWKHF